MSDTPTKIFATWNPWYKKVSFYCPSCDTKLSAEDPLLPINTSCPKCRHEYELHHAIYPIWRVAGFLFLAFLVSVSNVDVPRFNSGRFIIVLILSIAISSALFTHCKRRFKIPTLYYIVGSLVSAGWIAAVAMGGIYFVIDSKTKVAIRKSNEIIQEKLMQDRMNSNSTTY